jgi:hypothetical protein
VVEGVRRPVLHKGKQVHIQAEPLYEVEYSDQLLIRLLEATNPGKYGRHHSHEHIAKLWETDPEKLSDKQLQVLADYLLLQAHNGDEAAAVETRRQIEAGTFVIDAEATAVEST